METNKFLNNKLKIYIISQNESRIPPIPFISNINPDLETGDSIAALKDYSELRAQYWVWKNTDLSGSVGFFHHRRYLDLSGKVFNRPYRLMKQPTCELFVASEKYLEFDLVAPCPEYMGETVAQRYARTHSDEDLKLVCSIIKELYPDYEESMNVYLSGKEEFFCNMYIMKADVFSEYCTWLFTILDLFTKKSNVIRPRVHGYLAERLFGVWYSRQKSLGRIKWAEVPRVAFWCFDDKNHHLKRQYFMHFLLPPGSRLAAIARHCVVGLKKIKKER